MDEVLQEIIDRANSASNKSIEMRDVEAQFQGWLKGKMRELEQLMDGRAESELKADESRRHAGISSAIARATLAVSGMHKRAADVVENRERRMGGPTPKATMQAAEIRMPSLAEFRSMRIAQDDAGGYLVREDAAGPFFSALQTRNVILAANPLVIDMQSDRKPLPGEIDDSDDPDPVGEGGEIGETDMHLTTKWLSAKKYPIRTRASNELLEDSNPEARSLIGQFHVRKLAKRLDRDWLEGNHGPVGLVGLRRWAGVHATELGSGNGATPTLDHIRIALGLLEDSGADMSRVAIFMAGRTWTTLTGEKDLQDRYQIQPDPAVEAQKVLFGRPVFTTKNISVNETVGSSHDCSWIGLADMSRIAVGRRVEYRVLYDPFSYSKFDQTVVQTITRMAFAVVDADAVELITGVRP